MHKLVIARADYHLTVLVGKLTASDIHNFEVLDLGKTRQTWKKKSYRGAARPYYRGAARPYARLPSSVGN